MEHYQSNKKMKANTNSAQVNVKCLPSSTKYSVEICNNIRGKTIKRAYRIISDVVNMKRAIPIRRFNFDLGHKPGLGAASYPVKASGYFLELLDSIKLNAESKGLNSDNLVITFAKADRGRARYRGGRKGRQKAKNTHVHLIVEEKITKENTKKEKK